MNLSGLSPLQRSLVVAGGALLLPVIVLLALQLRNDFRERQQAVEQAAMESARAIVVLADSRVEADLKLLRVLATSPTFADLDWQDALERARTVAEINPGWNAITLTEADTGQLVFDSDTALADDAPATAPRGLPGVPPAPAVVGGVERQGQHCPCVRLRMPVPAAPAYVLTVFLDPQVFQDTLRDRLPAGAVAALVDREGRFLARSVDYADRVGTPATTYVRDAVARGGSGLYEGETYEGLVNVTAYTTSESTGWSAHVAIDRALIEGPRARTAAATLTGAIVALTVAGGMVAYAIHDLTARRREEARLMQLQKSEAIGQFTGTVVHDFNNLLAVMQACLNQIVRHSREPETIGWAKSAKAAIIRGTRLTNQLLSFARQGDGVEVGAVDLEALLAGMEDLLRRSLGPQVRLEVRVDPEARHVIANPDQLELALMNLAVNARDAMQGEGAVTITTRTAGGMVELRVADTGPGIPKEVRGRLFEPLFTTKPPGKGTGLGLAQVAGAARQAGGTVESLAMPKGGGATFVMRLPAVPAEAVPAATSAVATGGASA